MGRVKFCPNGPGHMTEMAAMSIYGKHFTSISFFDFLINYH